uniref:Uncharacterized protein n=1 Tax=viral metagenome TaxID=1070528 RepID=A0A6M3KU90_9ZZZZ
MAEYKCPKCGGEMFLDDETGCYLCHSCFWAHEQLWLKGYWTRDAEEAAKRCGNCAHQPELGRNVCCDKYVSTWELDEGHESHSPPPDFRCKFWRAKNN